MQPDNLPPMRRDVAIDLWRMSYVAICPHLNTMLFDGIREDADWPAGDLEILRRCDLVVLVPGWRESAGARAEVEEAKRLRIAVYEWVEPGEIRPLDSTVNTTTDSPIGELVGELAA